MSSVREVELNLGPPGLGGTLRLSLLQREPESSSRLIDLRDLAPADGLLPVRLLEDSEYVYAATVADVIGVVNLQPTELFSADEPNGKRGRLRTGSYVGVLPIEAFADGRPIGRTMVEVLSRKLDYLDEYRYMLGDLSNEAVALVLERFAPSRQRFVDDWKANPRTVYERFLHIQSVLTDPSFIQAVMHVIGRPHVEWVEVGESRSPHRHLRPASQLVRRLVRPGPREQWPGGFIPTLPRSVDVTRTEATVDTVPNRFVRFVLDDFLSLLLRMSDVLTNGTPTGPSIRGRLEVSALIAQLQGLRGQPFFSEVSDLDHFPLDNQVILKRPGYRELLHAYLRVQVGLALAWDGAIDLTGAQRDIAKLYEYWAFVRLLRTLESLCDHLPIGDLVTETKDGLTLSLKRGTERRFTGRTTRLGRTIDIDLFYNKSFGRMSESWTLTMRPDCSIRLQCSKDGKALTPIWLHFDAKYRLSDYGLLGELAPDETNDPNPEPVRDDLLKMHVYLSAIRRSVGSYVLYPGPTKEGRRYRSYREVLPGIGAFALRPERSSGPISLLSEFLDDVLIHLASVTTEDRRYRYWEAITHDLQSDLIGPFGWEPVEGTPPADTRVLIGFVHSDAQRRWISRSGLYNLRADSDRRGAVDWAGPEVTAQVLVVYDAVRVFDVWSLTGEAEIKTAAQLIASGYPQPRGHNYICLKLSGRLNPPATAGLNWERVKGFAAKHERAYGAPVLTTWADLVREI